MIRDIFLAIVLWSVLTPPLSAQTRAEIRDRVFVTAQRAQASAAGQALAQAAGRIAAGTAGLEALLREQQDISKAISDQRTALAKLAAQPGAEAELSVSRLQSQIARGRDKLAALDVELMADFPEFRELTNPAPLSIAEVQALLRADEALVMTMTVDSYLYTWAVSPTASAWTRAELARADLRALVQGLRAQLRVAQDNRAGVSLNKAARAPRLPGFDRAAAHRIYQHSLAPLEPVIGGARHAARGLRRKGAATPEALRGETST